MSEEELKKMLERVHDGVSTFDYSGTTIPSILLPARKFDEIMAKVAGKAVSVDTNLNILQDGMGHVFVEVSMTFSDGGINEKYLLNANEHIDFFELLAKNSMLALVPVGSENESKVFMIQLPRPERAVNALNIIKTGLEGAQSK